LADHRTPRASRTRGFALALGVLSLPFSGQLLLHGGRLVTFGLALVHRAVRLVASGHVVYGVLSRFAGAVSGQCRALLGCSCPLFGRSRVLLVVVHSDDLLSRGLPAGATPPSTRPSPRIVDLAVLARLFGDTWG
jgi:hypothetical protein